MNVFFRFGLTFHTLLYVFSIKCVMFFLDVEINTSLDNKLRYKSTHYYAIYITDI